MTSLEIIGIYALLLIGIVFNVFMIREAVVRVVLSIEELDSNMAQAIQQVGQGITMTNVPGEGMNPIQLAIAQWIGAQAQSRSSTIEAIVTPTRSEKGQFEKVLKPAANL